ncbi:hypothetical protein ABZ916_24800 [Streptomyces sp. NPDC046853]|uniref:hypothetical protein n=1 Tax=Streptomyces sp. NPDC046853 TaxID=3154920 RepID=UPI00340996F4
MATARTTSRGTAVCAITAITAAVVLVGCGSEDLVGGSVARTGASQAGKLAFREAGHPIKGKLTCSSDDQSDSKMVITCKGTTEKGKPAKMTADLGTDSKVVSGDKPRIRGASITGTVDGEQVFKKDCIGQC